MEVIAMKQFNMGVIGFKKYTDNIHYIDETIDEVMNETKDGISITKSDILNMMESKKVDLSSFIPQDELNPKVWDEDGYLNSRVRLRLLDIADAFVDTLDVDWVEIDDIILTGSLANYNWSKFSDFDVHVIIDFKKVDERSDFVSNYFNSKKKIWNNEHESLKIYGFPVELYVQDKNEEHTSSGIYSLEKNEWIMKPEKETFENVKLNKKFIKQKSQDFIDAIESLSNKIEKEDDEHKLEVLSRKVKYIFDKIKGLRKEGLKKSGEFNSFNIIFKVLRRMGYIDTLYNLKLNTYDKIKSLK